MEIVALILSCITLLINAITVFMLVLAYKEQKRPTEVKLVDKREDHTEENKRIRLEPFDNDGNPIVYPLRNDIVYDAYVLKHPPTVSNTIQ